MSREKREVRRRFREAVFERDRNTCVVCGLVSADAAGLDAHHVWPREKMPNGGYVRENGVTLCDHVKAQTSTDGCHARAERILAAHFELGADLPTEGEPDYEVSPHALYAKIGSSQTLAESISEFAR